MTQMRPRDDERSAALCRPWPGARIAGAAITERALSHKKITSHFRRAGETSRQLGGHSQNPALTAASPPTRQLRYVAVPPGRSVAGMAHAHLVLKQSTAPHRSAPPQKKIIAQAKTVRAPGRKHTRATIEPPASAVPAAMIPLDEPAAKPTLSQ